MEDSALYPLKFYPLFKNKIWGGNKIKTDLGIDYSPLPNCGEMWILSGVEGNESMVENGFLAENNLNEVLEIYNADLIGEANYARFGNEFPLLIKIIDANDRLSVQVHPDDAHARQQGLERGKTEMWYVMDAEKNAIIIDGFSKKLTPESYQKSLADGTLMDCLNAVHPVKGDVFFIPGGRVHAIGKGILLAEIQQTSDTTYRIYDWDRTDNNGNHRQLHTQQALEVLDFSKVGAVKTNYSYNKNATSKIVECPYFTTSVLTFDKPIKKDFGPIDSFVAYTCIEGICAIRTLNTIVPMRAGECILVPAIADIVELFPETEAKVLEVYIDNPQHGTTN